MTKSTDVTPELSAVLRRLKLGRMLDTLPERLVLAKQRKLSHRDFLLVALQDEIAGIVTERVIDRLEMVEVEHRDGHRDAHLLCAAEQIVEPLEDVAAVVEPGQRIGQCEFLSALAAAMAYSLLGSISSLILSCWSTSAFHT